MNDCGQGILLQKRLQLVYEVKLGKSLFSHILYLSIKQ